MIITSLALVVLKATRSALVAAGATGVKRPKVLTSKLLPMMLLTTLSTRKARLLPKARTSNNNNKLKKLLKSLITL